MENTDLKPIAREMLTGAEKFLALVDRPVTVQVEYDVASETRARIRAMAKSIEAKRVEITRPMNESLDAVNALFKKPLSILKEAEKKLAENILEFQKEQERIRQAQEDRLRREEEARAKAERDKLLLRAQKAEDKGKSERAEELIAKAGGVAVAPVMVARTFEKNVGFKTRKVWKHEIVDINLVPRRFMIVDEVELRVAYMAAIASGGADVSIPGVRIYQEEIPC